MKLGEGKRRVLMLLNEYSGGGKLTMNGDLSVRMNNLFDMAQKEVAAWQPLVPLDKIEPITATTGNDYEFRLTEDAANCLPLFVASQMVGKVMGVDRELYNLYLQMRGMLPRVVPKGKPLDYGAGGGGAPDLRLIKAREAIGLPVSI